MFENLRVKLRIDFTSLNAACCTDSFTSSESNAREVRKISRKCFAKSFQLRVLPSARSLRQRQAA